MGLTNFSNGVASFGMPVLPGLPATTGAVFFVCSVNGSNGNSGKNPTEPFSTIDYAVGQCTANKGDLIVVMPGHVETVIAAAGLDLDVAGITIFGVGKGTKQPVVVFTTDIAADMDVDAADVTVVNLHFKAGFADLTAVIDVNATDFTLRGCRFSENAVNENALIWVQDAAAAGSSRITIEDCFCIDKDAANTHFVNFAGTGDGHIVRRNTLHGDWGTMAIGGAGVVTNILVYDNIIFNAATTNDAAINLAATATGLVARNLAGGGAAQANGFLATGCLKAENYYSDLSDASAILDPIAT